jgi:RHS repeat-associated protein
MRALGGIVVLGGLVAAASCSSREETDSQRSALLDGGTDGGCRATQLTASKTYLPPTWNDATEAFSPAMKVRIPAELPVIAGNAGNAPATLTFSAVGVTVTCNYLGGASVAHPSDPADITQGLKYLFVSCSNGAGIGNVVNASSATLHVDDGDDTAATTTVSLVLGEEAPCAQAVCDPNEAGCAPPGESVFESRASLIGRAVDKMGNAVSGVTFEVRDLPSDNARMDVSATTGMDGSFRLRLASFSDHEVPGVGAQHVRLVIDSPSTVRAFRDAWLRPGDSPNFGDIVLVTRDPNVSTIGAAGGTATDSQGRVQLIIPPGALAQDTPIRITPFTTRADVSAPLPDTTLTTYAFEMEPSGTQFAVPVTVKVQNYRNVPSNIAMPVGVYDPKFGAWEHETSATLVGGFWQFQTTHFSVYDVNGTRVLGDLIHFFTRGRNATHTQKKCGVGSAAGLANGSLSQSFTLPGVTTRGQRIGLTLNYDSGLAGSHRFDYGTTTTQSFTAVPSTAQTVPTEGSRSEVRCVPRGTVSGSTGGAVNACVVGACAFTTAVVQVKYKNWMAGMTVDNDQILDANQTAAESGTFVNVPLDEGQQPVGPSFLTRRTRIEVGANTSCASTSGGTFGVDQNALGTTSSLESGAVAELDQKVFIHHRFTSPFGAGWGVSEIDRLFVADPDHVIAVSGDGREEEFRPRAELKLGYQFPNSGSKPVFGRDPQTNEIFAVTAYGGQLVKVNADLTVSSPVVPALTLPGRPHDLAITYVNNQRVFLVACDTGLVKVDGAGVVTNLGARTIPGSASVFNQAHVAARGDLVFYVSGEPTAKVVKRLRLTDPTPSLVAITMATGGDQRLDPSTRLGSVQLTEPTGLAFGNDGGLYLADRGRNAVYRIEPDSLGEISGTSQIFRVIGRQGANFGIPVGDRYSGIQMPMSAPVHLSTAPDGTLLVVTAYGVLQYDRPTANIEWLAYNKNAPDSDLTLDWYGGSGSTPGTDIANVVATGARTMLFARFSQIVRVDVPNALASTYAPTRTLELVNGQWFLVDASAGTKDVFNGAGLMIERRMRTNELLFSVEYYPGVPRVKSITNPANGTWSFTYLNGKIRWIDDPAGRTTFFDVDGQGDLQSFTEPDGEKHAFTYVNHHMTQKVSPSLQVTSYEYSPNGNLSKSSKPTGEVTTIHASMDSPPQKGAGGAPVRVGSYQDALGATHTITTNQVGQVEKDQWTADAVSYTRQTVYDPYLYANVNNTSAADTRVNKLLLPATSTLNGVQEGRYVRWDVRGRVYRIGYDSNPANDFETFTYDANDRLVTADGDGSYDITRFEYENATPEARLVRVWRANDMNGQPTVTAQETKWFYQGTDPYLPSAVKTHGVTYTYDYDPLTKNLRSVTDGLLLGKTVYERDSRGNVKKVSLLNATQDEVAAQFYQFDANDRLIVSRDALNNPTVYGYSWQGCGCSEGDKVTSVHTPDLPQGVAWKLEYDPTSGRLTTVRDPDGNATQTSYTATTNRVASVTDANLHTATMGYDGLGRLASATDAVSRSFARAYPVPSSGAWTGASVLAASPNATAAPTSLTAPLADGQYQIGIARFQDKGNPAQLSFYRDATFELSYGMTWDRSRRPYQRRDRSGMPLTTGNVLPPGPGPFDDWTSTYDVRTAGPATTVSDATYTPFYERSTATYNDELDITSRTGDGQRLPNVLNEVFTRDGAGRVTQIARTFSTYMYEPSQLQGVPYKSSSPGTVTAPLTKYTYDANGRVKQWTDGDGIHDVFFDSRGLVWKITVQGSEGSYLFEYDSVGRNTKVTYPGGLVRTQVYDREGRITSRCYTQSSISRCYGATYDPVGNPLTLTDPDGTDTVTYDGLDRLQSITRSGAPTQTFDYNALGGLHTNGTVTLDDQCNKLPSYGGGTAPCAVPKTYNGTDVTRNAGGFVTLLNGVTLKYSRRGALIGATNGGTGEWFGHDAENRRISRTVSQTANNVTSFPNEEYYLWNGPNVTAVIGNTGVTSQSFLYEGVDQPLRLSATGGRFYYELDLAGNVRALRRPDGSSAGTYQYAGFGGEIATSTPPVINQPLRWKARWWDSFTGLYDVRARQWSPAIGAFTSIDELSYHRDRNTLWGWPGMSPIRWRDPWGRDYESTGLEGIFLRNADAAMMIAGTIAVTAGTIATGGLALEAGLPALEAAGLSGAFGGAAGWGMDGFIHDRPYDPVEMTKAGVEGATIAVLEEALIESLFGRPRSRSCPIRERADVNKTPKPSPHFTKPTNPPQQPPTVLPEGHSIRVMGPTDQYPNGYWVQTNAHGQPVDPSTGKPPSNVTKWEGRARTHVPLPGPDE